MQLETGGSQTLYKMASCSVLIVLVGCCHKLSLLKPGRLVVLVYCGDTLGAADGVVLHNFQDGLPYCLRLLLALLFSYSASSFLGVALKPSAA